MLVRQHFFSELDSQSDIVYLGEKVFAFRIENLSPDHIAILQNAQLVHKPSFALLPGNRTVIAQGTRSQWEQLFFYVQTSRLLPLFPLCQKIHGFILMRQVPPVRLPHSGELSFHRPLLMGIINATPDSFFAGSRAHDPEEALERCLEMEEKGADLLDIGGVSTRPGSQKVEEDEELRRVLPVLRLVRSRCRLPISIDTTSARVASQTIAAGADIVNDISGFRFDAQMLPLLARERIPAVLMHMAGEPATMQQDPGYTNVLEEIGSFFEAKIRLALSAGCDPKSIILDPGIGFGKRLWDNVRILHHIEAFFGFGKAILLGTSRKSFLGKILDLPDPSDRLEGTLATTALGVSKGINIFRVHDIPQNAHVLRTTFSILDEFAV
ncbi:MAG TPA: dihydropteroate synthase [Thermotogota bacterium]|nr:dihydropteroate synthase [Thermotogota bacterium]